MLDWLSWPADLLLYAGGVVASWFVSKDASSFVVIQMMIATLVLAALVSAVVYWQRAHFGGRPCTRRYFGSPLLLGARHRLYSRSVKPPLTPINGVLFIVSATLLTIVAS
jgi:hypothetical protein